MLDRSREQFIPGKKLAITTVSRIYIRGFFDEAPRPYLVSVTKRGPFPVRVWDDYGVSEKAGSDR